MIVIIDYDMGNLASIKNMLHRMGCDDVKISDDYSDVLEADKLILPGVGAFDQGMKNLEDRKLGISIRGSVLEKKTPILGICLGMQLLGHNSEEGVREGLGLLPFSSVKFRLDSSYKVPHMGWAEVKIENETPLTMGIFGTIPRYYFVHSYHAVCNDDRNVLMTCNYGYDFTAAVYCDNIYGVQFHPEKSHKFGMKLLENFIRA